MSYARWLTQANQILHLYFSIEASTESLTFLAIYVVKVYALTWFSIKTHPIYKNGERHLWKLVFSYRDLSTDLKDIIDLVTQRNSYYAPPVNLFLVILTDPKNIFEN